MTRPAPKVHETWILVPSAVGQVRVRIIKPVGAFGALPAILYVHGGGWVLGGEGAHDLLVRELAAGARAAVVFVDYDRTSEARFPVAIEQAYATAQWVTNDGEDEGLDPSRLAIAGDSVGGDMAAAVVIVAKQRGDVTFCHQSLYYPVADATLDAPSYDQFADGPYLRATSQAWFWDGYLPERDEISVSPLQATPTDIARIAECDLITASPLRATLEDLAGLPEAFVIVDEDDVVRDDGAAYAHRLTQAGVRTTIVRRNGSIHDFVERSPLRSAAPLEQAVRVLRTALHTA